jgi:hypothetical protein
VTDIVFSLSALGGLGLSTSKVFASRFPFIYCLTIGKRILSNAISAMIDNCFVNRVIGTRRFQPAFLKPLKIIQYVNKSFTATSRLSESIFILVKIY